MCGIFIQHMMTQPNARTVRHLILAFDAHPIQTGRMICTAVSLSILPTVDNFPFRSFLTISLIRTMAPRCQSSTAALLGEAFGPVARPRVSPVHCTAKLAFPP